MVKIKYKKQRKSDIDLIVETAKKLRIRNENNSISLRGAGAGDIDLLLYSGLDIDPDEEDYILRSVLFSAVASNELSDDFSAEDLLNIVRKKYWEKKTDKSNRYTVLTGMYLKGELPISRLKLHDCLIQRLKPLKSRTQARMIDSHNEAVRTIHFRHFPRIDDDYCVTAGSSEKQLFKIFVSAKNAEIAYRRALGAFGELRGLLSYLMNRNKHSRMSTGSYRQSLNDVRPIQFSTVHQKSGELAEQGLWYYPEWSKPGNVQDLDSRPVVKKNLDRGISVLKGSNFPSAHARRALRMYCDSTDNLDLRKAFLELWTTLEFITTLGKQVPHEKVVRRASSIYKDKAHALLYLNHYRDIRNGMVHGYADYDERFAERVLFQLNRDVCAFLDYFVFNQTGSSSATEFEEFFDAPFDNELIKMRLQVYERVLRFRRDP